jgi:hypothetical protein
MNRGVTRLRIDSFPPTRHCLSPSTSARRRRGLDPSCEVSWSNVRDKLIIGLSDAAHLLAPVAIASNLGIGHVQVPVVAPINLGVNGNAITVSHELHAELAGMPTATSSIR